MAYNMIVLVCQTVGSLLLFEDLFFRLLYQYTQPRNCHMDVHKLQATRLAQHKQLLINTASVFALILYHKMDVLSESIHMTVT